MRLPEFVRYVIVYFPSQLPPRIVSKKITIRFYYRRCPVLPQLLHPHRDSTKRNETIWGKKLKKKIRGLVIPDMTFRSRFFFFELLFRVRYVRTFLLRTFLFVPSSRLYTLCIPVSITWDGRGK